MSNFTTTLHSDTQMQSLIAKILRYTEGQTTVYIACSGGIDSMFLVKLYSKILPDKQIVALIVDHNLQENSSEVACKTAQIVKSWGVKSTILEWIHGKVVSGIEENARNARYQLITNYCKSNDVQSVAIAHHIDDKIETFLMNSMRGTGLQGLTSMQEISNIRGIEFFRPMINEVDKSQITQFMQEKGFTWFEDLTNADQRFIRNKIRHSFNFSSEQKQGILQTIKNLETELVDKKKTFIMFGKKSQRKRSKTLFFQVKSTNCLQRKFA